jgi:hypothetical protein
MRQITTNLYRFSELSDSAKETARNWYRENALDYEWYDFTIEDAKEIGKLFGLEIDKIYFSGFWCQGDGASFTGSYSYAKGALKAVKAYAPTDTELHSIVSDLQSIQTRNFYSLGASISVSGHYSHSGSMSFTTYGDCKLDYHDITESDESALTDQLRYFADWIYKRLYDEYYYLMSDECIDETIEANEYEFTESGDIA